MQRLVPTTYLNATLARKRECLEWYEMLLLTCCSKLCLRLSTERNIKNGLGVLNQEQSKLISLGERRVERKKGLIKRMDNFDGERHFQMC